MARNRYLLALPLVLMCLAFDPPADGPSSVDRQTLLSHLLKNEAALLSRKGDSAEEGYGIDAPERIFGADPYRIRHLPQTDRYLVLLRNSSRVVLCDGDLRIIDSAATPPHPVALDVIDPTLLFVGGEQSGTIRRYRIVSNRIEALSDIDLQHVVSIRDLVYVPQAGSLFLIDDVSRRLVQVVLPADGSGPSAAGFEQRSFPIGAGALRILGVQDHLIVDLMLDHTLQIIPLRNGVPDFNQASEIVNAGPFWSVEARARDDKLIIAAGGIENHPLSRERGEFGYIDSFLYLFTLARDRQGQWRWHEDDRRDERRFRAINLSARGVLTPKALVFGDTGKPPWTLWVTGYGADRAVELIIGSHAVSAGRQLRLMPGISDLVVSSDPTRGSLVCVSPLLDRIAKVDLDTGAELKALAPLAAGLRRRFTPGLLGEVVFFTDLMSPNNSSRGELSRFTCEACHFEGLIDGRIHFTGRDRIHTTTKPLRGLSNNVPLFSRGGDQSLSSMVMAEFLVANQNRKGFFTIRKDRYPWMSTVADWPDTLSPTAQREGLLAFFAAFDPKPNPWRRQHPLLTPATRRGLVVFRDRCADCHQPIRSTRTIEGIEFQDWERWLTDESLDLVWGAPFFSRTGVTPYVDPAGSRIPSLRRVWMKYPLFTDGSAKRVRDVLEGFRYRGSTAWHRFDAGASAPAEGLTALTPQAIDDLEALLRFF